MPQSDSIGSADGEVDDATLRSAMEDANLPSLQATLVHLTGDRSWIEGEYRPRPGPPLDDNDSSGLPPERQTEIRDAALDAVRRYRAGALVPSALTPDQVAEILEITLGEEVPPEYGPLLAEELGVRSRDVELPPAPAAEDFSVLVIGSGLSGLCAAIKLQQAGIAYQVIEKNPTVGGTWHENVYPGCGVDTPSHLYSFSFDMNVGWDRYFAKRGQVSEYLERLADDHDVRKHIRFSTEVERADWDDEASRWVVGVVEGGRRETITANAVISAVGQVNRPSFPPIDGVEATGETVFAGPAMHTAAWDPSVELAGKRVAVIGTGASSMQLVPRIVDEAEQVVVFQRSKQWALPHPKYTSEVPAGVKLLMAEVPFYAHWYRLRPFWNFGDRLHPSLQIDPEWEHPERSVNAANDKHRKFLTKYISSELGDRQDLLDACLPDYPPYGKRPLIDNGWYRTMTRDDVELVTESVARLEADRVVTASGAEYPVDVVVFATGFRILQFLAPMEIHGRSGRTLRETWGTDDARAYLGVTVPDFPNLFMLNGPNTFAGHGGSAIIATEFQTRYAMQLIGRLMQPDTAAVEVREDVFWDYNRELDAALDRTIWSHRGMTNYFRNDAGRIVVSSPWKYVDYWQRTLAADPDEYRVDAT
ncbi:NAD(P)/FAD-dependent oxidoreductase [Actinomycetospora sp. TBRC 11914]|uniref:flavin-containing monooxygenase n=1 Tax=Actinomycetospora sp. TBRC 11914 TaxID=2729387 RepID=UPI00145DC7D7|nr:NAD(P)/FAD-dependent oxidoreductase [Actinomycetospora sp. TBRC 11914]NMO91682.1 NAD(P)/FAD-dependent oxidoreductase [Actinomycetospora sp. TBRC 11914]